MAVLALQILKYEESFILLEEIFEKEISENSNLNILWQLLKHLNVVLSYCVIFIHLPFISKKVFYSHSQILLHLLAKIVIFYQTKELSKVISVVKGGI